MARKIFFIILIGIVSALLVSFFPGRDSAQASVNPEYEGLRQQILDATVRITVYAEMAGTGSPATQTVKKYTLSDGLGTLVQDGLDTYIVTHDHWSLMGENLHKVEFRNAADDLLLELDRSLFYELIRYRDGGTMVLVAPEEIVSNMAAVPVNKGASLTVGQSLLIAFWQPEAEQEISVEPVAIEMIELYKDQPAFVMRSLNGRIVVHGNSGSGVFSGGQFVGTMWETLVRKQMENGQLTGETSSTDMSRAALAAYEIERDSELVAQSLKWGEI